MRASRAQTRTVEAIKIDSNKTGKWLKRGYEAGDLQNTEWKCIMVRAVHMVVGISLCVDQDFLIPSKWIIVV